MWGVEKYIGHWDGYAGEGIPGEEEFNEHRPNNYYLYSDSSGRFSMLPWGTDQTWDEPPGFDGQDGRLFDLCLEDETCAACSRPLSPMRWRRSAASTSAPRRRPRRRCCVPGRRWKKNRASHTTRPRSRPQSTGTRDFIAERPAEAETWLNGTSPPPGSRPGADGARPQKARRDVTVLPLPGSPLHALGIARLGDRVRSRVRVDAAGRAVLSARPRSTVRTAGSAATKPAPTTPAASPSSAGSPTGRSSVCSATRCRWLFTSLSPPRATVSPSSTTKSLCPVPAARLRWWLPTTKPSPIAFATCSPRAPS